MNSFPYPLGIDRGTNRMPAASEFADYHDAVDFQNSRLFGHQLGHQPPSDSWGAMAQRFRLDPRRDLDANLQVIASYLRPGDVFIDVGGGAGRVSLPLARSCREVVAVEPSPGMGAEFDASRMDAGIGNASRVQAEWMDADGIEGDVVFAGCVTYFVRDIVPFVEKLQASARRRVIVTLWSEPPACSAGLLFDLVYGEPQEPLDSSSRCCGRWISCPTCLCNRIPPGGRMQATPAVKTPWYGLWRARGSGPRTGNEPPAFWRTASTGCSSVGRTDSVRDGSDRSGSC